MQTNMPHRRRAHSSNRALARLRAVVAYGVRCAMVGPAGRVRKRGWWAPLIRSITVWAREVVGRARCRLGQLQRGRERLLGYYYGFPAPQPAPRRRRTRRYRSVRAFTWVPPQQVRRPRWQLRHGVIAFGPQHPAAHGILRLQMQLSGEVLRWLDPQFGLLHRGTEKLMENRNLLQSLPYFDRFDYVANLFQEHAYCLAVEGLYQTPTVLAASTQLFRVLFDEVSRLLNHLLTLSATSLDMSVMGPIFWAFEEREALMELCERASGARMHTALYRPFAFDTSVLSRAFLQDMCQFLTRCGRSLAGAFLGLFNNRIFKTRLSLIGQANDFQALAYGLSGLMARSGGRLYDLRLMARGGYGLYRQLTFRSFLGRRGDNLDRFVVRVKEAAESFRVLSQVIQLLTPRPFSYVGGVSALPVEAETVELKWGVGLTSTVGHGLPGVGVLDEGAAAFLAQLRKLTYATRGGSLAKAGAHLLSGVLELEPWAGRGKFSSMEGVISHFRGASEGWPTRPGFTYQCVESPKGEVGVTIVSAGGSKPLRTKLRTPVSHNMHLIPSVSAGATFADFVATFCSLDIVLGEIDR